MLIFWSTFDLLVIWCVHAPKATSNLMCNWFNYEAFCTLIQAEIATNKGHYEKVVSNIQEIKSRDGKIIAVVTKGDKSVKALADHVIEIPEVTESLTPILASVPLQLLAYHIAVMRGCNVDQPRNLAKSVTVE